MADWGARAPLNHGVNRAGTIGASNGKLYVFGGFNNPQGVQQYDPVADTWADLGAMPRFRAEQAVGEIGGLIYTAGGLDEMSATEEYNPATDTWTLKAAMPTPARGVMGGAVGGKLYVVGGDPSGATYYTDTREYDPATDTWTTRAPMPTGRSHGAAAVLNGKLYVLGGVGTGSIGAVVEEYDPAADTWATKASMPVARSDFAAAAIGGRIYAIGGSGTVEVDVYDPATDTWDSAPALATTRFGVGVGVIGPTIYAVGGGASPQTAHDAYTPSRPPNAPVVADQGTFNRAIVNRVELGTFSDPDPGDSPSAWEFRYRPDGTSAWTVVAIGNPNNFWDSPAGTFVADLYEAQSRSADQGGLWGPWSTSFFITAADAPPGPTWLDPTNGQTIDTASYTGTISAVDVDESEWRLVADNAGVIDESTIVQGPVLKTSGDLRSHTWEGLANDVTVWWQVRTKFEGLWSAWVSIRTPVSFTPPVAPQVTVSAMAEQAALVVAVSNPAPTGGEPVAAWNDVYVDDGDGFERRAAFVAPNSNWIYRTPISGLDYAGRIRVRTYAANGTWTETTTIAAGDPVTGPFQYGGGYA